MPVVVNAHSLRPEQLPRSDLVDVLSVGTEDAHPTVVVVCYEVVSVDRDRHACRPLHLSGKSSARAESLLEVARIAERLHALIIAIGDQYLRTGACDSLRVRELAAVATFAPDPDDEVILNKSAASMRTMRP